MTLLTVLILTLMPSFSNSFWITAPQRGYEPNLLAMIADFTSSGIILGEWCGLELSVGIPNLLSRGALLHHFVIVPGLRPKYRAVCLTPLPDRTILTAFILAFEAFGLEVYIPPILSGCFQGIET